MWPDIGFWQSKFTISQRNFLSWQTKLTIWIAGAIDEEGGAACAEPGGDRNWGRYCSYLVGIRLPKNDNITNP